MTATFADGLLEAYVDGWDGVCDRARLDAAGDVAMTVGALYQVATYQALLPALDAPDRAKFVDGDVAWASEPWMRWSMASMSV